MPPNNHKLNQYPLPRAMLGLSVSRFLMNMIHFVEIYTHLKYILPEKSFAFVIKTSLIVSTPLT